MLLLLLSVLQVDESAGVEVTHLEAYMLQENSNQSWSAMLIGKNRVQSEYHQRDIVWFIKG